MLELFLLIAHTDLMLSYLQWDIPTEEKLIKQPIQHCWFHSITDADRSIQKGI